MVLQVLLQTFQMVKAIVMRSDPVNVLNPRPETIIVSHEFDYGEMKFQNIANTQLFYAKDNLKRTLVYVTLLECEEQEPLLVRLPIPNGPNYAIHVSKFPCGLNIEVGGALQGDHNTRQKG